MSIFTLMNKNNKVLDFEYDMNEHLITKFYLLYGENEKYAPFRTYQKWYNR